MRENRNVPFRDWNIRVSRNHNGQLHICAVDICDILKRDELLENGAIARVCIIRKTKRCDFPERSVRFCKTKCILGSTPTLLLISQNRPAYAGNVKRRLNTIQTPFALRFVASLPPMLSR